MLVLNTTSPSISPRAPKARPAKTVPSSSASLAMSMAAVASPAQDSEAPTRLIVAHDQHNAVGSVATTRIESGREQAFQGEEVQRLGEDVIESGAPPALGVVPRRMARHRDQQGFGRPIARAEPTGNLK